MKKLYIFSAAVALCAPAVFAAQQTLTGTLTDSMCKSNHAMMNKGAMKMSEKDCTLACVKAGQKYVLMSEGKAYKITNQDFAGLPANAGGAVTVSGDVSQDGSSITISKVQPATK
jgi:hypothetical protein